MAAAAAVNSGCNCSLHWVPKLQRSSSCSEQGKYV